MVFRKHHMDSVLDFLFELRQNNNREWFDLNRKRYQAVKAETEAFIDSLIEGINDFDELGPLSAKQCMFRLFRDTRFSKDKTPYKNNFGGYICVGGRKAGNAGYYLHIQPGESFIGGGLYMPDSKRLAKIRAAIADDASRFHAINADPNFQSWYGNFTGPTVKSAPRGYKKDHPEIELLRLKSFTGTKAVTDAEVTAPAFRAQVLEGFQALTPLIKLMNRVTAGIEA